MQAEQRQNKHDDDDQTDEVNDSIHDRLHTTDERVLNHSANSSPIPKFLSAAAIFVLRRVIVRIALQVSDAAIFKFLKEPFL